MLELDLDLELELELVAFLRDVELTAEHALAHLIR